MTVQELIERLSQYPMDHIVVLSEDAEGNGFSPLADMSEEEYIPDSTYSGDLGENDEFNAVVLWPVN